MYSNRFLRCCTYCRMYFNVRQVLKGGFMSREESNLYSILTGLLGLSELDVKDNMAEYKSEAKLAGMTITSYLEYLSKMSPKERAKYRKSLKTTKFKV